MNTELLDIRPRELKFTFELKKQSTCSVQLVNNSDQYVAFKVKTTSPKKYCVRPNTGIIHPKSSCEFIVTMQAQRVAPPDMQCKDKFLIQGTIVPSGTAAEAITTGMFAKDSGKYIEENKLRVVLVSPPQSPVLLPANGVSKEDYEVSAFRDHELTGVENHSPLHKVTSDEKHLKLSKDAEELKPAKDVVDLKQTKEVEFKLVEDIGDLKQTKDVQFKPDEDMGDLKPTKDVQFKLVEDMEDLKPTKDVQCKLVEDMEDLKPTKVVEELKRTNDVQLKPAEHVVLKVEKDTDDLKSAKIMEQKSHKNAMELELAKDVEELKYKLRELEAKLSGAETTISMLRQERSTTSIERESLQQQLAVLRRKDGVSRDQVGFPFLFVCMVALIGMWLGHLLRN